jgi:hypothetical protein
MIYENEIEQLSIDLLKEIGYEYYHGQEIARVAKIQKDNL